MNPPKIDPPVVITPIKSAGVAIGRNAELFLPILRITPVNPDRLHDVWEFIERGLEDIRRKIDVQWRSPDVYGALRSNSATALIVARGTRQLGHFIWHKRPRDWNPGIIDVFVWTTWTIPLRERLPSDNMLEVEYRTKQYLSGIKHDIGAAKIIGVSSYERGRALVRKFGYRPLALTYEYVDEE